MYDNVDGALKVNGSEEILAGRAFTGAMGHPVASSSWKCSLLTARRGAKWTTSRSSEDPGAGVLEAEGIVRRRCRLPHNSRPGSHSRRVCCPKARSTTAGLVSEAVRDQVRHGRHFLVDYPLNLDGSDSDEDQAGGSCDLVKLVEAHACQVETYYQHGQARRLASSFAIQALASSVTEKLEKWVNRQSRSATEPGKSVWPRSYPLPMIFRLLRAKSSSTRLAFLADPACEAGCKVRTMCTFGLFSHGGVWGVTRQTKLRPHFTNYINSFLDWHGASTWICSKGRTR